MRMVISIPVVVLTSRGMRHSRCGFNNSFLRNNKKQNQKGDMRKAKAAAPTVDDLDNELMKYMGQEARAAKLDDELDAYFKADGETC